MAQAVARDAEPITRCVILRDYRNETWQAWGCAKTEVAQVRLLSNLRDPLPGEARYCFGGTRWLSRS